MNFSMKRERYLIFLIWRMGKTALMNLDDKNQKAEWQDSKIDGNIERTTEKSEK